MRIQQIQNNFHFLTMNFVGTVLTLCLLEVLIITLTIFGGAK